jgi:hypothetical protein
MKRYQLWLWCEGFNAVLCEAHDEEELADWFFHHYQRNDSLNYHFVERIDYLGFVKDGQPIEKLPEAKFLAMAREVKQVHLARERNAQLTQQESTTGQHASLNVPASLEEKAGRREIRNYRIWYSYAVLDALECEAATEEKAAVWFHEWCQEHNDEITTYSLERIEDMEVEAARMAQQHEEDLARARESKPLRMEPGLAENDFVGRLRQLKEKTKQQV